ncbi:hypothetical protein V8C26DRAFT_403564 [Trichoderma gracile]
MLAAASLLSWPSANKKVNRVVDCMPMQVRNLHTLSPSYLRLTSACFSLCILVFLVFRLFCLTRLFTCSSTPFSCSACPLVHLMGSSTSLHRRLPTSALVGLSSTSRAIKERQSEHLFFKSGGREKKNKSMTSKNLKLGSDKKGGQFVMGERTGRIWLGMFSSLLLFVNGFGLCTLRGIRPVIVVFGL